MKQLETQRLILRDWKVTDLDDFYTYAKVDGVGQMAGWPPHTDKTVSATILEQFITAKDCYALVLKENNQVIGSLGIHDKSMDSTYPAAIQRELGYVLSKDYWGQGLMSEAVKAAISYAFCDLDIDVLWCGHFTTNPRSKRVIEKAGFTFYAENIYHAPLLNKTFNVKQYIMTKDAYFQSV